MKNQTFTLDGKSWGAVVNGKVLPCAWLSKGAAKAGIQVELRRLNKSGKC